MATGQGILDRLKKAKAEMAKPGVLPLVAFYGREPAQERERMRMYGQIAQVMAMSDTPELPAEAPARNLLFIDLDDAIAVVNVDAGPIEFLVSEGEMSSREDAEGMAGVRFYAALKMRSLVGGSQVGGMKSQNLEFVDRGAPTSSGMSSFQVDCRKILNRVRAAMPEPWLYRMLESVVVDDEWLDLRQDGALDAVARKAWRGRRRKTLSALHFALDAAAVALGFLTNAAFVIRWPGGAPEMPPALKRRLAPLR